MSALAMASQEFRAWSVSRLDLCQWALLQLHFVWPKNLGICSLVQLAAQAKIINAWAKPQFGCRLIWVHREIEANMQDFSGSRWCSENATLSLRTTVTKVRYEIWLTCGWWNSIPAINLLFTMIFCNCSPFATPTASFSPNVLLTRANNSVKMTLFGAKLSRSSSISG